MAVFFKRERFTPVAYGHFWLSETPQAMARDINDRFLKSGVRYFISKSPSLSCYSKVDADAAAHLPMIWRNAFCRCRSMAASRVVCSTRWTASSVTPRA